MNEPENTDLERAGEALHHLETRAARMRDGEWKGDELKAKAQEAWGYAQEEIKRLVDAGEAAWADDIAVEEVGIYHERFAALADVFREFM